MLQIIQNKDYGGFNLLNPETGKLLFKDWKQNIERVFLSSTVENPKGRPYYFIISKETANKNGNNPFARFVTEVLNEKGMSLLQAPNIEIWYPGFNEHRPILKVCTVNESNRSRYCLKELGGKTLTGEYGDFAPYGFRHDGFVKVINDGKFNYLRSADWKPVSDLWFDGCGFGAVPEISSQDSYLDTVKYKGRFRILRKDGTLDPK